MMESEFDQSHERYAEIKEKIEADRREGEIRDLKAILETNTGRRFIWRYMGLCGLFENPMKDMSSTNATIFNCGMQKIGQMLLSDMRDAKPEAYVLMQQEEQIRIDVEKQKFLKEMKDAGNS